MCRIKLSPIEQLAHRVHIPYPCQLHDILTRRRAIGQNVLEFHMLIAVGDLGRNRWALALGDDGLAWCMHLLVALRHLSGLSSNYKQLAHTDPSLDSQPASFLIRSCRMVLSGRAVQPSWHPRPWRGIRKADISVIWRATIVTKGLSSTSASQPYSTPFSNTMATQAWLQMLLNPSPLGLILSILIAVSIPVLLHYFITRASGLSSLPSILVVGSSGSGKTAFVTLVCLARRGVNQDMLTRV